MSLVFLPGFIYGGFEYFKPGGEHWKGTPKDKLICFVLLPIFFFPFSIWKLYLAVRNSPLYEDNESTPEEDEAYRYTY